MRVTKEIDATSIKTRIAGGKASKNRLLMSRCHARVSVEEEVVWVCRGRSRSLRAVIRDRTKGIMANSRSLKRLLDGIR